MDSGYVFQIVDVGGQALERRGVSVRCQAHKKTPAPTWRGGVCCLRENNREAINNIQIIEQDVNKIHRLTILDIHFKQGYFSPITLSMGRTAASRDGHGSAL